MKNRILTLLAAAAMALAGNAQESDAPTQYHVGVGDNKGFGSIPVEVGFGKQFNPTCILALAAACGSARKT